MKQKIVVAFGGNALGKTPQEQLKKVRNTAKAIADLVEEGYEIIITHGNGPQVGMINEAMEYAARHREGIAFMPFAECGAMSQGYIGYHLQQSIRRQLEKRGIEKGVVSVITQVAVDQEDPGFQNFTKPVGNVWYTKEKAEAISAETGYVFREEKGKGFRRVVPSPRPEEIIELNIIKTLAEAGNIVIAAGGGGIPVVKTDHGIKGVAAVIDKDYTSSLLAKELRADILMILTNIEKVCINYGTEQEEQLSRLSIDDAKKYLEEGQFGEGSMKPKVEACLCFVQNGGSAVITRLECARKALKHRTGTWFEP
jgi:carbamate kinase